MNLTKEKLGLNEIESDLDYTRQGQSVKVYPKIDCTIDETDELDQLRKVSGSLYFYGQMLGEIETAIRNAKITLKKTIGQCYQTNYMKLQASKARITEKLLEHLINTDVDVIEAGTIVAELEGNKIKIDTIITALRSKDTDLNELSRRSYLEAKGVNKLT